MTVTYTSQVTPCKGFSCLLKLLLRWRGSVYKLIWSELLVFIALYYGSYISYRFMFGGYYGQYYEILIIYCRKYSEYIPLSFVLGFYVSLVTTRWWNQFSTIPYPDNLAILIGASIKGQEEKTRIIRRSIVRYVCAAFVLTLTLISPRVKKRFPTLHHLVEGGLLTEEEEQMFDDLDRAHPIHEKYWLPLSWAANVATKAREDQLIKDAVQMKALLDEITKFRSRCNQMLDYHWVNIPLVYTQVVTIAVYTYFLMAVIGKQCVGREYCTEEAMQINSHFPMLLVMEFLFYMGWLKVAEVLINPYGNDDDDFEVLWLIDRHVQTSYLIVDKVQQQQPKLVRDKYWKEIAPTSLPHTYASRGYINNNHFPPVMEITLTQDEQQIFPISDIHIDADESINHRRNEIRKQSYIQESDFRLEPLLRKGSSTVKYETQEASPVTEKEQSMNPLKSTHEDA